MTAHQTIQLEQRELDAMVGKATMQGGGVTSAVFVIAYGLMWLRRRLSTDDLANKKERTEGSLLEIVIKERNSAMEDAREAWAKRAADAELIGKMSAQVDLLGQLNHKTNNEVHLMRLLSEKQTLEISSLRQEIESIRSQMQTCATCPLRRNQS